MNAAGGTLASQWKEYFYVDSLPDNVLATKAEKKVKARFGGSRREDDIDEVAVAKCFVAGIVES